MAPETDPHSYHSTLREQIVEHIFIADALRFLWKQGVRDVQVLRSEFDTGGYDLVLSARDIVRYIQLKTRKVGGKAGRVKVSLTLQDKPNGCVIWIDVNESDLTPDKNWWFGGPPGTHLRDISKMQVAKHTKGDAQGKKAERHNHRIVNRGKFKQIKFERLMEEMFGDLASSSSKTRHA